MDDRPVTLDVSILGRDYRVACKESERDELLQAVQFLDRRMRDIRDAGKIVGAERIAVMAALNITNELLRASRGRPSTANGTYRCSSKPMRPRSTSAVTSIGASSSRSATPTP